MIDEVKFQELKDAAAHAKHNSGRVSVECGELDELLDLWERFNMKTHSCDGRPATRAEFDAFLAEGYQRPAQASEPAPTAEGLAMAMHPDAFAPSPDPSTGSPGPVFEVTVKIAELEPDATPIATPEPTIQ